MFQLLAYSLLTKQGRSTINMFCTNCDMVKESNVNILSEYMPARCLHSVFYGHVYTVCSHSKLLQMY